MRQRSPSGPGLRSRVRGRVAPALSLLVGASACALAASALFVPGFVFGVEAAEPAAPPATGETVVTLDSDVAGPAAEEAEGPSATSEGRLLVTLPWGAGAGEVGLAKPTEGLVRGPEAVAVAPDGRIAVLDSVNRRLVYLDPAGSATGSAAVPLTEPRFLAVDDKRLYVLDCDADRLLVTYDWDGTVVGATVLPELDDVVTGLFATPRGPSVEIAHDGVFLIHAAGRRVATTAGPAATGAVLRPLAGRPVTADLGKAAKVTFAPGRGIRVRSFRVDKDTLSAAQTAEVSPAVAPGRAIEHLVSVDGDGNGGLVIGARLVDAEQGVSGRAIIALTRLAGSTATSWEIAASGAASTDACTMFLADTSLAYVGQPYIVAPDGRVLQPVAGQDGYSIVVHTFPVEEVQP
ncbi:MAG: hypothetical protein JXA87_07765 [Thermoleophilia bacterium]|nr:hypothetical protein [Thermoleophilia bacterium]